MRSRSSLIVASGALLLGAFSACGVEDRALSYEYRALGAAGILQAGSSEAGATNGGGSGSPSGGELGMPSGGAASGFGGTGADAGASTNEPLAGAAGADIAGSSGNPGSAGGTSGTAGAATAGAPSAGSGGAELPCGDLNQDAVDDCMQTLVQNSRFDSAVSNWNSEPTTTQIWDTRNATAKAGSGSLLVSNTSAVLQAVGSTAAGSHQCIPVTPLTNYDFAARVMLADAQAGGQAGVNVWLFDDDACQGNIVTGITPLAGGVAGTWTALSGKLWVPGSVHSMYVRLVAIKPFTQAGLSVLIDDVLVAKR